MKLSKGKVELMLPLFITDISVKLLKINATVIDTLSNENVTKIVELDVVDADFYVESDPPTFKPNKLNSFNVPYIFLF